MQTERISGDSAQAHRRSEAVQQVGWSNAKPALFDSSPAQGCPIPDRPICPACEAELTDPSNRRHGYAFSSCPACGPRPSILERGPFVRANTSMAAYAMCSACDAEYRTAGGRRYRDETVSCPSCGPALTAVTAHGTTGGAAEPVRLAARALLDRRVVAIRDERRDSFCCDATSPEAVSRLRSRRGLFDVPLAVMVRDLDEAARVADLGPKEISLLSSVERPVVLVSIRTDSPLTGEVAAGNRLVGLLLPYTPLHLLLLKESGRPLVILPAGVPDTSSRPSVLALLEGAEMAIVADRSDAAALHGIAPRLHELSVPAEMTRFALAKIVPRAILGCGAGTPGAVCLAAGTEALIAQSAGSVDGFESALRFEGAVSTIISTAGGDPEIVVHDLDERNYSTRFALDQIGVAHVAVQHHHAHMAACLAENNENGTALGVVFDFGGLGADDTMWGGEILRGNIDGIERLATFRPIVLAGEHVSTTQIWRVALAMIDDVWSGEPPLHAIPLFRSMPRRGVDVVRRVLDSGPTIRSHAIGLQLEAIAAIVLSRPDSHHLGALIEEWETINDATERLRYPIVIRDGAQPWEIDLRPALEHSVGDLIAGVPAATILARVRNAFVASVVEVLRAHGVDRMPVAITGDLFERSTFGDAIAESLGPGAMILRPKSLPGDDRAIAFGQVVVTDALMKRNGALARANGRATKLTELV